MSSNNTLLNKVKLPGETFQIPSQGIFYQNGELDPSVKSGEIEVFSMSSIDEIVFSTPDKLLSGNAVTDVFSRCIPQVLKPTELSARDIDFLMICLRFVTFGQFMDVQYTHDCKKAKNHSYSIDLQKMVSSTTKLDPTIIEQQYQLTLPNGQFVKLKPMQYGNLLSLYDKMIIAKKSEGSDSELELMIVDSITSVIESVDGITELDDIKEWVRILPLAWKQQLEKAISGISEWGVDFTVPTVCTDCGSTFNLQISANPVNFFLM